MIRIVDASTAKLLPATLAELRVECLDEDKDAVLWYLLVKYASESSSSELAAAGGSRTIVFCNSIDAARRLVSVLGVLGVTAVAIHAEMQQRQRLKNLDRFRTTPNTVLVASDVAARGLDIPLVNHVIHYHLPRTAELYVHRSGRSARMQGGDGIATASSGVSVLLCGPTEVGLHRRLCKSLGRWDETTNESTIPVLPLDLAVLGAARKRVTLARRIEALEHSGKKKRAEKDWVVKTALAAEMLVSDEDQDTDSDTLHTSLSTETSKTLLTMRAELKHLLAQSVLPRGVMSKYPTLNTSFTSRVMQEGESGRMLVGYAQTNAVEDAAAAAVEGGKSKKRRRA